MKDSLKVIGVIPARYASERLSFKLLRKIGGKTLLEWTWANASLAKSLERLIIACDDPQIQKEAEKFSAEVILTSPDHLSGTDRIAEAVSDIEAKVIVNIQADEPLLHPSIIENLAQTMLSGQELVMATVKKKIETEEEINNPNVVKVICNSHDFALYFSRFPIPYFRQDNALRVYYKHLGIYAYTKDFLYTFKNLPNSNLEAAEKLEQLRALEAGHKIKVIETSFDSQCVDVEEDLEKVGKLLAAKN